MTLDFTPLDDNQLIDLIRSACQEAASRNIAAVAQSVMLDEAERARIVREATAREQARQAQEEASRLAKQAAERVKAEAEKAERDKHAAKVAETWEYKEEMGAKISAIIKPTREATLKVWANGADKRIYIGGGYNDNDCTYFHTGNSKNKPKSISISTSKDLGLSKEDVADAKAALLPLLSSICEKWNAITIPIPEYWG